MARSDPVLLVEKTMGRSRHRGLNEIKKENTKTEILTKIDIETEKQ